MYKQNIVSHVFSSSYGIASTAIAGFGGLFADAIAGKDGFIATLIISLTILAYGFYKEMKIAKLYKNEIIPIPVVISVDDNTPLDILFKELVASIARYDKQYEALDQKLWSYFGIAKERLLFKYDGDMYNHDRLVSFLQIIRHELNNVQQLLENQVQFHILFLRRPAIAMAVGSMFRTDGIVVYQNSDHDHKLNRVAKIDSRKYKEHLETLQHFKLSKELNNLQSKELLLVIQISSHKVNIKHKALRGFSNVIQMHSLYNGTLPPDDASYQKDFWVENAQEIYNIVNEYKNSFESITILHSMPEAIGIILGMSLENYWDINILQYDAGDYKSVVRLNKIKYYF
ncbi:hypothetical protein MNB_SM-6-1462 [hydrothermal vent metagenome]|uniref:SMODS-associated and fused to various effectors domain-containing protein n=1 Tax=hydrothermal vent metagenome TaxID=652676 RepID=A0A1W1CN88_9ZZZZ